jgi:hypothetical protein
MSEKVKRVIIPIIFTAFNAFGVIIGLVFFLVVKKFAFSNAGLGALIAPIVGMSVFGLAFVVSGIITVISILKYRNSAYDPSQTNYSTQYETIYPFDENGSIKNEEK